MDIRWTDYGKYNKNDETERYPLSEAQKRIWYTQLIHPKSAMFNIGGTVYINGNISVVRLRKAIKEFLKRNEVFKFRFALDKNDEVYQYMVDDEYKISILDFSHKKKVKEEYSLWENARAQEVMSLIDNPLIEITIIKFSNQMYAYMVKAHHIIIDGWSMQLLVKEIAVLYNRMAENKGYEMERCKYSDYISSEKRYLNTNKYKINKEYWNKIFAELPENKIESEKRKNGKRKSWVIQKELSNCINEFCDKYKISKNVFFIGICFLYMYETTEQDDLVIGTPVLGRSGRTERNTIGMFVNVLPLRYQIDESLTYMDFFYDIRDLVANGFRNCKYPYNHLIKDLQSKKDGCSELYNICVNYYGTNLVDYMDDIPVESVEFYNGEQEYSMQIIVREWLENNSIELDIDYQIEKYNDIEIQSMFQSIIHICNVVCKKTNEMVRQLDIVSNEIKSKLVHKFNCSKFESVDNVVDMFRSQVKKYSTQIAVQDERRYVTYQELDDESEFLSYKLRTNMEKPNEIIGIMVTHSVEAVIGILAIIKAGAAFMPIDNKLPLERKKYIIKDAEVNMVLTNMETNEDLEVNWVVLDDVNEVTENKNFYNTHTSNEDLAYIIYTSGTTGNPKGVMIENGSLASYAVWARNAYQIKNTDVFPLYSSFSFDLTITSIFVPLISGAKIIAYEDNKLEYVLYRILKDNFCTVLKLTPSHLILLDELELENTNLRTFIVGGDILKTNLARRISKKFRGMVKIFNEYGPTEATVGCMIYEFCSEVDKKGTVPIGRPAANTKIYILNQKMKHCPIGIPGEIYIGGQGLARGYCHKEKLTSEKFIFHPITGERLYKTGDLAKFITEDCIEFIGRNDRQVKIRGHRVELGEIENLLIEHSDIREAFVAVRQHNQVRFIVAYYSTYQSIINENELIDYLKEKLPIYMIPSHLVKVDHFPLTLNGKIDIRKLPNVKWKIVPNQELPKTEVEKHLYDAISSVLQTDNFSMQDDFYQIGGDSIKAIQIVTRLQKSGYYINASDIMRNPTLIKMIPYIKSEKQNEVKKGEVYGEIENTPILQWFEEQKFVEPMHYTQSMMLELHQDLSLNELKIIMNKLFEQHDMLKSRYDKNIHKLICQDNSMEQLYEYNLFSYSTVEQEKRIKQICRDMYAKINEEHLLVSCVFHLKENQTKLFLCCHHLIIDGVSWNILLEDINDIITSNNILNKKTNSYKEWAWELKKYTNNHILYEWKKFSYKDMFKRKYEEGSILFYEGVILEGEEVRNLQNDANVMFHTTTYELLISAIINALRQVTGETEITLMLESHGRDIELNSIDITRTVGWFTYFFPFNIIHSYTDLNDLVVTVKDTLRMKQRYSQDYMLDCQKRNRSISLKNSLCFNFLGNLRMEYNSFNVEVGQYKEDVSMKNGVPSAIEMNCMIQQDNLVVLMKADSHYISQEELYSMIKKFKHSLKQILNLFTGKESVWTASDFDTIKLSKSELMDLFE